MNQPTDRFERIARTMRASAPLKSLGRGASLDEIARSEARLGVTFPRSYRTFLQEFGFACWPDDIYGVHADLLPALSVVAQTEQERHEVEPRMPKHLIPFHPDGYGNHYCLDSSRFVNDECPVVFWDHEKDEMQVPVQTHATFLDWLDEMIQRELRRAP